MGSYGAWLIFSASMRTGSCGGCSRAVSWSRWSGRGSLTLPGAWRRSVRVYQEPADDPRRGDRHSLRFGEGGVERDRRTGERLADGAVRLGVFGRLLKSRGRQARHASGHGDVNTGDALARLERDISSGVERFGRIAALGQ